ncbi:MAG: CBS domain-containing protein [Candidatus Xenobia bacterium]
MKLQLLSPDVKARLRAVQVAHWMMPAAPIRSRASLRTLIERARQGSPELAVVDEDDLLVGRVRPADAARFPKDAWETLLVSDIMRQADPACHLSPESSIEALLDRLASPQAPPQMWLVVREQRLLGQLPHRLLEDRIEQVRRDTPAPPVQVRLCADEPVLRADATRLGRLTRVGICRRTHRITHLVVKVDGWAQREVAIHAEQVRSWGPGQIQTRCSADDVALLDDFISYVEEPAGLPAYDPYIAFFPVLPCVKRSVPESTACVGRDTRLWSGSRSLGRWLDAGVDADNGQLHTVGYVSGLFRKSEHQLPADAIYDLDDDRIDLKG